MKIAAKSEQAHILNLEPGEELFAVLVPYLEQENIPGAVLSGLGAAKEVEIAYYNLETKEYERHKISEDVEVLSLQGNFAFLEEKPVLHFHGVFGRRDFSTFGGHLFSCRISGAGELHIFPLEQKMSRALDKTTGLNLLCAL